METADAIRASITATPEVDQVLELPAGQIERLMVKVRERLRREHPDMDSYVELDPG